MKRVIFSTRAVSRRSVRAADDNKAAEKEDTRLEDLSAELKDDFDYALDGFDKLARSGKVEEALNIMNTLSSAINAAIEESANEITM